MPGILLAIGAMVLVACGGGNGGDTPDGEDAPDTAPDEEPDTAPDGRCSADGDCDDAEPCTVDSCNEDGECEHDDLDADGDGHVAEYAGDGVTSCGGDDCNDSDEDVHPGAEPGCSDTLDIDCNGHADEDNDGDGFLSGEASRDCGGTDCDDSDEAVNTDATPGCSDTLDLDCNTYADEDNDGDGDLSGEASRDCGGTDCDDSDDTVYLDADEVCLDGIDQDCDTIVDGLMAMRDPAVLVSYSEPSAGEPHMAWTGSEYGIVFQTPDTGSDRDLHVWTLDATGNHVIHAEPFITSGPYGNDEPRIAWTGTRYGIVWEKQMSPGGNPSVHLMHRDEDWLSPSPEYEVGPATDTSYNPTIVWAGSEFGICWERTATSGFIECNAFDHTGTARWTADTLVESTGNTLRLPHLAWSGSEYLIGWELRPGGGDSGTAYVQPMSADGALLGTPRELDSGAGSNSYMPKVAWAGSLWAVTWMETLDYTTVDGYLMLLDPSGSATTPAAVSSRAGTCVYPAALWTGSEIVVTWVDTRLGFSNTEIHVRTFDPTPLPTSDDTKVTDVTGYIHASEVTSVMAVDEIGVVWTQQDAGVKDVWFNRLGFCN